MATTVIDDFETLINTTLANAEATKKAAQDKITEQKALRETAATNMDTAAKAGNIDDYAKYKGQVDAYDVYIEMLQKQIDSVVDDPLISEDVYNTQLAAVKKYNDDYITDMKNQIYTMCESIKTMQDNANALIDRENSLILKWQQKCFKDYCRRYKTNKIDWWYDPNLEKKVTGNGVINFSNKILNAYESALKYIDGK